MDKKKKILIGAVLTVVILLAGVMAGFLIANAEKKGSSPQNVENGALTNKQQTFANFSSLLRNKLLRNEEYHG